MPQVPARVYRRWEVNQEQGPDYAHEPVPRLELDVWSRMQCEVSVWALHNFGDSPPHHPFLGLIEEVGEYIEAVRDGCHGARLDALGDQSVYAMHLAHQVGLGMTYVTTSSIGTVVGSELLVALSRGARGLLKHAQGIRGYDDVKRRMAVLGCLRYWHRWATDQAASSGDRLVEVTERVWAEVRKRNWRLNPSEGRKPDLVPVVRDDLADK